MLSQGTQLGGPLWGDRHERAKVRVRTTQGGHRPVEIEKASPWQRRGQDSVGAQGGAHAFCCRMDLEAPTTCSPHLRGQSPTQVKTLTWPLPVSPVLIPAAPAVRLLCLGSCILCFLLGHTLPFERSKLPLTRLVSDQAALPAGSSPGTRAPRPTMHSCARSSRRPSDQALGPGCVCSLRNVLPPDPHRLGWQPLATA